MLYLDFETTNKDYGSADNADNRIIMVAWCVDGGPVKHYAGDILDAEQFWGDYYAAKQVCAYNAKFEMKWLQRHLANIFEKQWHDPMIAEYVLLGNQRPGLSLDKVAGRYGEDTKDSVIDALMKGGVCPSEMPQDRLLARCRRDVRVMRNIFNKQLLALIDRDQLAIYKTRINLTAVLVDIESSGMLLDAERVREEYEDHIVRRVELETELDKLTGGINLRSSDQLAEFLYTKLKFPERKDFRGNLLRNKPSKRWPEGKPKTDKATLEYLAGKAKTKAQKRFIELRTEYGRVNAALTKNLEFFQGICRHYGGWFKAVLNQTATATHRLSSSGVPIEIPQLGKRGVQFQNMPRQFKRLFTAPDGYVILEADFPQLEFRVAAFLGHDIQALDDIHDPDFDAHVKSASVMNQIEYGELLQGYRDGVPQAKALRQQAKPDTFKPLYGGTKGTPEQERWYQEFQQRYNGVYNTQQEWLTEVTTSPKGELKLPWGMRFRWNYKTNRRGLAIDPSTGKPIGPSVANYPVQCLATAEIVPIALTALHDSARISKLDVKFCNTVHDSVICMVHEDDLDRFIDQIKYCFTTAVYEYLWKEYGLEFRVPLGVEITFGQFWGEGTSIIHDDVSAGGHKSWQKE